MKNGKHIFLLPSFFVVLLISSCSRVGEKKPSKDFNVSLKWKLINNDVPGEYPSEALLTLTNKSEDVLLNKGWNLYFNSKPCALLKEEETLEGLQVVHINGDYFKIAPTDVMTPLKKGQSISLLLRSKSRMIKKTDFPGGFYFVSSLVDGDEEFFSPDIEYDHIPVHQMYLGSDDHFEIETPESIFSKNKDVKQIELDAENYVLPTPEFIEERLGSLPLLELKSIYGDEGCFEIMKTHLEPVLGQLSEGIQEVSIRVHLDSLSFSDSREAYELIVDDQGVTVRANTKIGVFYASKSLLQIFPVQNAVREIPYMHIRDSPRFPYRGLMLDVARNFQTKEELMKILDVMGYFKMNKLHLHFSDDEGWRIEIVSLPELAAIGGRRSHMGFKGLLPSYGSGYKGTINVSDGYYSKQDFIEILKYAKNRNIEIIPEVEFPGHARAAIKAMEYRALLFLKEGRNQKANEFRLSDVADTSSYFSVQNFSDNTICPCQEGTYHFLEEVIYQIKEMYKEANVDFSTIHLGADEVAHGVWEGAPSCQFKFKDSIQKKVKRYYLERIAEISDHYNVSLGFWDDITGNDVDDFTWASYDLSLYSWNNEWGGGKEDRAYIAANGGYKTVLVPVSNLYFDQSYSKNSDEPGFYWGSYTNTYTAFSFLPLNMFQMEQMTKRGDLLTSEYFDSKIKLTPSGINNVLGIEGSLFSETVKSSDDLEYLLFPKLLGLAERAWSPSLVSKHTTKLELKEILKDKWELFVNVLGQRELARLSKKNISYRLPTVGIEVTNGMMRCNIIFPGLKIMLRTRDGEIKEYRHPLPKEGVKEVFCQDVEGRRGRPVVF